MYIYQIRVKTNIIKPFHFTNEDLTKDLLDYLVKNSLDYKFYIELVESDLPNSKYNHVYIDFSKLLSETGVGSLPFKIKDLPTYLNNDQLLDSYSVNKVFTNRPIVRGLQDLGLKIEYTSIENSTKRLPISDNPKGLKDMVLSEYPLDLSNFIVFVDGQVKRTYLFEDELYVKSSALDFVNNFNFYYMDTSPIGGHTNIYVDKLSFKHTPTTSKLYIYLPEDIVLGDTHLGNPLLSICGKLYMPMDEVYKVKNSTTIEIDLRFLVQFYQMKEVDLVDRVVNSSDSILFLFNKNISIEERPLIKTAAPYMFQYSDTGRPFDGIVFNRYNRKILPYRSLNKNGSYIIKDIYQIYIRDPYDYIYPADEYDFDDTYKDHKVDSNYLNPYRSDDIKLITIMTN